MIYTPENPLRIILRGPMLSLKNDRTPFIDSKGRQGNRPNTAVIKSIRNIKAAISRQLPPDFQIITPPTEMYYAVVLGVFYLHDLPKSDVDNAVTTLQEATQDIIVEDDRQYAGEFPYRRQFKNRQSVYTELLIWHKGETHPYEDTYELLKTMKRIGIVK
jgi:hypothetical protein